MTIKDDANVDTIKRLWKIASVSILLTLEGTAVLVRFSDPQEALRQLFVDVGSPAWYLHLFQLLLLIYTVLLVVGWIVWTGWEFDILTTYLDFTPFVPAKNYFIILAGSCALALLIYFSDRIVVYTAIYIMVDIFAFLGTRDVDRKVAQSLQSTREGSVKSDPREAIFQALEEYYVRKPQLKRIAFSSLTRSLALIVALYGALSRPGDDTFDKLVKDAPLWPTYIAYVLVLGAGIAAETQITMWRFRRNSIIDRASEQSRGRRKRRHP